MFLRIIISEVIYMACGGCGSGKTYTLQLVDKEQHNETTLSMSFLSLEPLDWKAGNSAKVFVPIDGVMEGQKYSFVTLPDEKVVKFTTRIRTPLSDYKVAIDSLEKGDIIEVSEPSGEFSLIRDDRPALLLSNGVGIAAVRTLIKEFEKDDAGVGALTQINVDNTGELFKDEFRDIEGKCKGFKSMYVAHRTDFYQQMEFASQDLMLAAGFIPYFYVVGSDDFVLDVTAHLMSIGFDEADIVTDGQGSGGGCGCSSSGGCGCS